MVGAVVSLVLADLGRDALKVAVGLVLAILIALAFAIASVVVLIASLAAPLGPPPTATPTPSGPLTDQARVVALAKAQIGTPYLWGGSGPGGFDCSGLVQWVYAEVGVSLPRTAQAQFDATTRIPPSDLQPGDLVFFANTYPSDVPITHVGIYLGGGLMVNAPTDGDVVRSMSVFDGYWGAHFAGAGRVGA